MVGFWRTICVHRYRQYDLPLFTLSATQVCFMVRDVYAICAIYEGLLPLCLDQKAEPSLTAE